MNTSKNASDRAPDGSNGYGYGSPIITVVATAAAALFLNLVIYGLGRAAGGDFRFTASGQPAEVDALTVAGFTVLPLLVGMTAVAILTRIWPWVVPAALVVAPAIALGTILVMTIPADFDDTSKITLALCHVMLVPVTVTGLLRLRGQRHGQAAAAPDIAETTPPRPGGQP